MIFFIIFHKHVNSEKYRQSAVRLLNSYNSNVNGPEFQLLMTIMFFLEKQFFSNFSNDLSLQSVEPVKNIPVSDEIQASGRGKLRYISGYVVAELKYLVSKKLRGALFAYGMEIKICNLQSQMKIFNSLCTTYDELNQSTCDPESLNETRRKQNEREGLTNIKDSSFEFFLKKIRNSLSN